ncbi:PqqD family protein [Pseudomonas sp. UW4]|uniref:PqqD family protein n=1 Tax=Pseudomonas sp. UW4 TaxID=1207075 RepID=UPI00029D15F9|nr:PqqD family protein [Pseudomonas sp. UW4]AFY19325.1 hypothetical protein PputUW4_02124 [Pseudomonas sp. UW4]
MAKITRNYSINTNYRESEVGDQILLYDPVDDEFHALNLAAKLIWDTFKMGGTENDILQTYIQFFGADPGNFKADIKSAINDLSAKEVLELKQRGLRYPVKQIVKLSPHAHPLMYETPNIISYKSAWMKANHPSAYLSVKFSDRWGPACD